MVNIIIVYVYKCAGFFSNDFSQDVYKVIFDGFIYLLNIKINKKAVKCKTLSFLMTDVVNFSKFKTNLSNHTKKKKTLFFSVSNNLLTRQCSMFGVSFFIKCSTFPSGCFPVLADV